MFGGRHPVLVDEQPRQQYEEKPANCGDRGGQRTEYPDYKNVRVTLCAVACRPSVPPPVPPPDKAEGDQRWQRVGHLVEGGVQRDPAVDVGSQPRGDAVVEPSQQLAQGKNEADPEAHHPNQGSD